MRNYLDRDKELKLYAECLEEKESLINDLQGDSDAKSKQGIIVTKYELMIVEFTDKLHETELKLRSTEEALADLKKMSKAKTLQNEDLRKKAEIALGKQ